MYPPMSVTMRIGTATRTRGARSAEPRSRSSVVTRAFGARHGDRIDAAYMTLIGLDRRVAADTIDSGAEGYPFAFPRLIAQAERDGKAVAMVSVHQPVRRTITA